MVRDIGILIRDGEPIETAQVEVEKEKQTEAKPKDDNEKLEDKHDPGTEHSETHLLETKTTDSSTLDNDSEVVSENPINPDESSVEEKIVTVLKNDTGPVFLICSAQNIDRIVSAYRAAKRSSRFFVVDIYTAWILEKIAVISNHTPQITSSSYFY